ncbi:hypothetical protein [Mesorhizobium sp. CAU 1732]|uniref:hypothetical protein n=1 Tax=Mesorhizobium sp. CAU 1732 TaxID=3140358 RepID=UPI003261B965
MPAFWNTGTATLTSGSAAVTGQSTAWNSANAALRPGDTIESDDGRRATILTINSATSITLDKPWRGTTQTAQPYKVWYTPDDVYLEGQARQALAQTGKPNIGALAGLDGTGGDKLPYLTGASTMALTPLPAFARSLLDSVNAASLWTTIGASAPPASAFRRGNILGPVSQSAGVPTGAVIDSGSNANGRYARFADGTQICTQPAFNIASINNALGVLFRSGQQTWTFPAAFTASPSVNGKNNTGATYAWFGSAFTDDASTANSNFGVFSSASVSTATSWSLFAIGRWF